MTPIPVSQTRVMSVDVLRGAIMLLLVSNPHGGFSFFEVAPRVPDNALLQFLSRQFSHVAWTGFAFWDLVMPVFVCLIGVSLPLSRSRRQALGETSTFDPGRALLRSATLFLLGTVLLLSFRTTLQEAWPLLLLVPGLPLEDWLQRTRLLDAWQAHIAARALWLSVLAATCVYLYYRVNDLGNYDLSHLLQQVALAFPFVFWISRWSLRRQLIAALVILVAWWLMFAAYPLAPATLAAGANDSAGSFHGFFAHWNQGANIAADFDAWFLNTLPRSELYVGNDHGYQTLTFLPMIASMIFGSIMGTILSRARERTNSTQLLLRFGIALLATGLLTTFVNPLIKSLWTSSWTMVSSGIVAMALAPLHEYFDRGRSRAVARIFAVAGSNSILLYVLAMNYRWKFSAPWTVVLGADLYAGTYGPIVESLLVMSGLWLLAFCLARVKLQIRI